MPDERPVLVLIGAPGAGKTRLGKRIARLLEVPFIDTDKRIVAEHGPIADMFALHGEPHFRAIERATVTQALTEHAVVALGGGAVIDLDTRAELARHRVVQLTVSSEAVEQRIAGGKRPLVRDGIASWIALVEARTPIYDSLSQRSIDTSHRPLDTIASEIADWIRGMDQEQP